MKPATSITASIVLGMTVLGNASATDAPRNLQPLFGNFLADTDPGDGSPWNAGIEVAVPRFKFTDAVFPFGYPEKLTLSYNVFALGTNTLLYTTPAKTISTPAIPAGCTDPNLAEFDWDVLFTRRLAQLDSTASPIDEGKRIHLGITMEFECYDGSPQWAYSDVAAVYSANLSGVSAPTNPVASWTKVFVGKHLLGLNGIDTDGNLVTDQLTITLISGPENIANATVVVVNGGNGVVNSVKSYPFIRQ